MPKTYLTTKKAKRKIRPAAVNIPFRKAVRSSFWLAFSLVRTKNVPIMLAIIPMGLDGGIQLVTKYESTNLRRVITGVLFGILITYIMGIFLLSSFKEFRTDELL